MLICTDKNAIDQAFTAKTPRPFREVMLEIYPDAYEDRNGRFHAPYDGYECPITGKQYSGGEYLPQEKDEESYRVMGRGRAKFPQAKDAVTGKLYTWEGTRAQNLAVWGLLLEQTRAYDAANSKHLGEVGKKFKFELEIVHIVAFDGTFGMTYINIMKSGSDVVIYKGGKKLAAKGEKLIVEAKVKSHGVRGGVAQTVIERPKVLQILVEPANEK